MVFVGTTGDGLVGKHGPVDLHKGALCAGRPAERKNEARAARGRLQAAQQVLEVKGADMRIKNPPTSLWKKRGPSRETDAEVPKRFISTTNDSADA